MINIDLVTEFFSSKIKELEDKYTYITNKLSIEISGLNEKLEELSDQIHKLQDPEYDD